MRRTGGSTSRRQAVQRLQTSWCALCLQKASLPTLSPIAHVCITCVTKCHKKTAWNALSGLCQAILLTNTKTTESYVIEHMCVITKQLAYLALSRTKGLRPAQWRWMSCSRWIGAGPAGRSCIRLRWGRRKRGSRQTSAWDSIRL